MLSLSTVVIATLMDTFRGICDTFGIHWQLVLIQSINFLCVIAVLYYFAFRPILKTLDERRKKIEDGIKFADDMQQKLSDTEQSVQLQLQQAQQSAREIVEQAQKNAAVYLEQKKVEANQMAQDIINQARDTLSIEKEQMLVSLKKEVKGLVLDVTTRLLSKELTKDQQNTYIRFIDREL